VGPRTGRDAVVATSNELLSQTDKKKCNQLGTQRKKPIYIIKKFHGRSLTGGKQKTLLWNTKYFTEILL
jgi:hypothetical protein